MILVVLVSWEGGEGVQVEDASPLVILEPKVPDVLVLISSTPPSSLVFPVQLHVLQHTLPMNWRFFCVTAMP